MKVGLVQKLLSVLNKVLEKLQRYDEGTMMGGFMGMMVRNTKITYNQCYIRYANMTFSKCNFSIIEQEGCYWVRC